MPSIFARNESSTMSNTMVTLLTVLLVLLIIVVLLVGALLFLRQRRKSSKAAELPMYNDNRSSMASTHSNHRRVTVRPSQSIHIYHEKQELDSSSEPESPSEKTPEIRITFPEEVDESGKRQSGRVVILHVGENGGVGMESVSEKLPAYEENGTFQSVDLEKVGGLVEKEARPPLGWK